MEKLTSKNAALVLDVLCGRLAFERIAVELYDHAIRKIERLGEPRYHALLDQFHHIRDEEKEHEEWLEALIRSLGGSAHETTSMVRLETTESKGIKEIIVDGHDRVMDLLHALLAAELADNAGWDLLVKLADDTGDRKAKLEFGKRLAQELQHLAFLREAVIRSAEIEILGMPVELPTGMGSVAARALKKPVALGIGGALAAMMVGAAGVGAALMSRRPRRAMWRRLLASS